MSRLPAYHPVPQLSRAEADDLTWTLTQVALLAAAVVAAPLAKVLRIGNVLGYLLVGVLIGPFGLGFVVTVYEVNTVLHFAEFGVVLLFLIGLASDSALVGHAGRPLGVGAQVALTGPVLAIMAMAFGLACRPGLPSWRCPPPPSGCGFGGERRTGTPPRSAGLRRAAVPGSGGHSPDRPAAPVRRDRLKDAAQQMELLSAATLSASSSWSSFRSLPA